MKLIAEYSNSQDAEKDSKRIRSAGVMTTVTSERSNEFSSNKTGATKVGLWVVFDDQYSDAAQLLINKKHKPVRIISQYEMRKLEHNSKNHFESIRKRFLEKLAAFIFGSVFVALIVYIALGIIKES